MREQKGYIFHKGKSWFVRYCDDVMQRDGTIKRKLVCKKLDVEYGGAYRTKASVKPFVQEWLAPINAGKVNAQSTMLVSDFVEKIYFPKFVDEQLRPSTRKGYRGIWRDYLKSRMGNLRLRSFRTVNGEQMLADIARRVNLGRHSLKHIKSFLSGVFKQAKRLGILDGINPMQDTSIPRAPESADTHAYSLDEVKKILEVLDEPARTLVLTAALTGLRKGEIRGIEWQDFNGKELRVRQSVWNSETSEPKTARSKAPIPVIKQLADALETHRRSMGRLAVGPIFQAGNGKPLNLDNLARRAIIPTLNCCATCKQAEADHKTNGHPFQRDSNLPEWHGWHAFRRGLATNLHLLKVDDKTIQAILRHSNVGITMNIYVKTVAESQVSAMDALGVEMENVTCTNLATSPREPVN